MRQEELDSILNSLGVEAYQMIRSWLFDKANSFAGEETGHIAVRLHDTCNTLIPIIQELSPNYFFNLDNLFEPIRPNENPYANIQTSENYQILLDTGMFFEFHPELSGNWEADKLIILK